MVYSDLTEQQQAFIQCILKKDPEFNPSANELKKLYRKLSLAWHPDKASNERSIAQRRELPGFDYLNTLVNPETDAPDEAFKVIGLLAPDGDFADNSSLILAGARRAQRSPARHEVRFSTRHHTTTAGTGVPTTGHFKESADPLQKRHQQLLQLIQQYEFNASDLDWSREPTEIRANQQLYIDLAYILRQTRTPSPFADDRTKQQWAKARSWLNPKNRSTEVHALLQRLHYADVHAHSEIASLVNELNQHRLKADESSRDSYSSTHFIHRNIAFADAVPRPFGRCSFEHCNVSLSQLQVRPRSGYLLETAEAQHSQFRLSVQSARSPLLSVDLYRINASDCHFTVDQSEARIFSWNSEYCSFNQCQFTGDFSQPTAHFTSTDHPTRFSQTHFIDCTFSPDRIELAHFDQCHLSSSTISGEFSNSSLKDTVLENCHIDAKFNSCGFDNVEFIGCDLAKFASTANTNLAYTSMHDSTVDTHHQLMRLIALNAPIEQLNWAADSMHGLNATDYLTTQTLLQRALSKLAPSPDEQRLLRQSFARLASSSTNLHEFSAASSCHERRSGLSGLFQSKSVINSLGDALQSHFSRSAAARPTSRAAT